MRRVPLHQHRLEQNPLFQQMLERHRRAAVEEERARRRIFAACIVSYLFWLAVTVLLAGWGMATTHVEYGQLALEAAILLGGAGMLGTLLVAYQKLG
jgi:hypothetical protein